MIQPVISILICSIYERAGMLASLLRELHKQIDENNAQDKVEVLTEIDNKGQTPTGTKRNALYQKASGKYSLSLDDDDSIPPYFIEELLKAAESDADCFATNGIITFDGENECQWFISMHNSYNEEIVNGRKIFYRYPNHIAAIKSEIAKQVLFQDIFVQEDYIWATELHNKKLIKTEYVIQKPIYFYRYNSKK